MSISVETLDSIWKVYYYVALFATVFFVLKLAVFAFIGGGTEVSGDFNTEFDSDTSFDFLSFQSLLAFLMGFGWMGYAGLKQLGMAHTQALLCALGMGFIFMFVSACLMFSVRKLEKNVKKDKTTAINQIGKAYTNFAPKGQGQVEIEICGQNTVSDAVNNTEDEIMAFDLVKVVKVENDLLYIEKN